MSKIREQLIINYVNDRDYASVNDLCEEFAVSPATMRRDLDKLNTMKLLTKVHGGAKSISSEILNDSTILTRQKRIKSEPEKKMKIAKYAVSFIKHDDIIFLDSSTTLLYMVDYLAEMHFPITVVTNDIFIAAKLGEKSIFNVVVIGGDLRKNLSGTVGLYAEQQISSMHFDKAFICFDTINLHDGITTRHVNNLLIKQKVIKNSIISYALGDSSKFVSFSYGKIGDLNQFKYIITDDGLSDTIYDDFTKHGINIIRAS